MDEVLVGIRVDAGPVHELRDKGRLLTKVGEHPVVVFWHEGRAYAIEDRCPHMGFPLHAARSRRGWSPVIGIMPDSTWRRAARWTSSPTMPELSTWRLWPSGSSCHRVRRWT